MADQLSIEECNAYVEKLMLISDQRRRYNAVEKILKAADASTISHGRVAAILSSEEGPLFLFASQAKALRDLIDTKIGDTLAIFDYDHVLCSRVLDYWNLRSIYTMRGSGCYYFGAQLPEQLSIDKMLQNQTKSFLSYACHDIKSDTLSFKVRCTACEPKYKRKRHYKIQRVPIFREKRIRKKTKRYITEM